MLYFSSQLRLHFNFKNTLNAKKALFKKKSSVQTFYKNDIYDGKGLKERFSTEVSLRDVTELINENANNVDPGKLHLVNLERHKKLGPIYSESIGPDVKVVWIADPTFCAKIFREGNTLWYH